MTTGLTDVVLCRALAALAEARAAPVPEAVRESLRDLAAAPMRERLGVILFLPELLAHPDAELAAAAVRALGGTDGLTGLALLQRALDDPRPEVVRAAIDALRASSAKHPEVFALGAFHRAPEVRRAMVEPPLPEGADEVAFTLAIDPACPSTRELPCPPSAVRSVLAWRAEDRVTIADAQRWLGRLALGTAIARGLGASPRDPIELAEVAAGRPPRRADPLDALLRLFVEPNDPAIVDRFFALATIDLASMASAGRLRVAASARLAAAGREPTDEGRRLLGLHVALRPETLLDPELPLALRREAARASIAFAPVRQHSPAVPALLASDLVDRDDLDLELLAALLGFAERPYAELRAAFDLSRIAAALAAHPERAALLLALPDGSGARAALLAELGAAVAGLPHALAIVLLHLPEGELSVVWDLSLPTLAQTLRAIAEGERTGMRAPARFSPRALAEAIATGLALTVGRTLEGDGLALLSALEGELESTVVAAVLGVIADRVPAEAFASWVLSREPLLPVLSAVSASSTMPWQVERLLSDRLHGHADPAVQAWAAERAPRAQHAPASASRRALNAAERAQISAALHGELGIALSVALSAPVTDLVPALALRSAQPSVPAVVALAMSHDPLVEVARQIDRFAAPDEAFLEEVIAALVLRILGRRDVGLAAHALLHRWEQHAFALLEAIQARGSLQEAVELAVILPGVVVGTAILRGVAGVLGMLHLRDPARFAELVDAPLAARLTALLGGPHADAAADVLGAIAETPATRALLDPHRAAITAALPDLSERARRALEPVAVLRGIAARYGRAPRSLGDPAEVLREVRRTTDLDRLAELSRDPREEIANEAALRLVMQGRPGEDAVLDVLRSEHGVPWGRVLAMAVGLFSHAGTLDRAAAMLDGARPPYGRGALGQAEVRFALAAALTNAKRPALDRVLEAVTEEGPAGWLRPGDVDWVLKHVGDVEGMRALAVCPHPHAYLRAVPVLLERGPRSEPDRAALRAFLDRGAGRDEELRAKVAYALLAMDDRHGWLVVLLDALRPGHSPRRHLALRHARPDEVLRVIDRILLGGAGLAFEPTLLALVEDVRDAVVRSEVHLRLLAAFRNAASRARAAQAVSGLHAEHRSEKITAIAEVFVWGMGEGLRLAGKRFTFHPILTSGLGHTILSGHEIHVSPVPLWEGVPHGKEVVEGLVLHEIGHHVHHADETSRALWDRAAKEGNGRLLNLVADEHLERNLRAVDESAGDKLKRLAAWAFRHRRRTIPITTLLGALGPRTADVLTGMALWAARETGQLEVEAGAVLGALEQQAHSFGRFFSALRLGLGNRWGDPKVEAGLALFTKRFRKLDMAGLVAITEELREIFGGEVDLVLGFGGHEDQEPGDGLGAGGGITDEEVQREVRRVLGRPKAGEPRGPKGPPTINVSPDEDFDPIHHVQRVPVNAAKHAALAAEVRRHSRTLRETFEQLGLRTVPAPARLSGRRLDPTRIRPLVLRGDPHVLLARELVRDGDLFLGMAIDCSGSMAGASIERARRFGVLLAEAARGLKTVDVRIFGFNERTLFDAGDAERCAVSSLVPTSGNNDAAALDHVTRLAVQSRRRGRLVVMISDGLPTDCSVAALRAVVRKASRQGVACAQVAVRPLAERAFPDYVEIGDGGLDASVAQFSRIVARLVGRVLAR